MKKLVVNEEEIRGNVKDIKNYMIKELWEYMGTYTEQIETLTDMIYNVNNILQVISDLSDRDYVILKYNPMGSWYLESEVN